MSMWDDAWLAQHGEAILEPELPIVDAHHHLWRRDGAQPYHLAELHADTGAGHRVEQTVFVECAWAYRTDGLEALRPVGETEAVAEVAAASARRGGAEIAGIVGRADMALGDAVDEVLAAHEVAGQGRFRGIRHATAYDPDPRVRRSHTKPPHGLLGDAQFRRGVARLAARGHSFDAWLYHPQIPELTALAQALPEAPIVLDHLGGPLAVGPYEGRRDEVVGSWRADMAALAACPNVTVKLGGIGMAVFGTPIERDDRRPLTSAELAAEWAGPILHVIEQLGPDRCMFESNFPVDKAACSYVTLWNAFKRIAAGASEPEKTALFSATARRVYRL
jgi:predicted TIM-barrel fold metal-dependent hydrolase